MSIVSTVHHCIFLPVRVELPESCPHCKADFTEGGHLREWNTTEIAYAGDLVRGDNPHFEPEGDDSSADTYRPVAYVCGSCGAEVEGAVTRDVDDVESQKAICQLLSIPSP